jgi:hypothetical protein
VSAVVESILLAVTTGVVASVLVTLVFIIPFARRLRRELEENRQGLERLRRLEPGIERMAEALAILGRTPGDGGSFTTSAVPPEVLRRYASGKPLRRWPVPPKEGT